ncbi:MAG: inorganic phosphate transporter [Deltaproteobacteria bacterium]|nr:MAG: inorganic phosphate transporter [Deltaproteobacteria bacterium]
MFAFFLSSGLFLGWSLGANDASNVFGTAVGSKMIRFKTAAACCSIFIILGAVVSGAGASHTLGKLGAVNAMAGAFIVAFSAGVSIYLMTRAGYPVSTSQAIVGAIIGWNFFSGSPTDYTSLQKIVGTWVLCPLISASIAVVFYKLVVFGIKQLKPHILTQDALTRLGLLLVGAFGSYSLGANNIANVMGVFVPVSPFQDISLFGWVTLSSAQQLFFIGGVAIAVGVFTYSKRVMETVGEGIISLSPVDAFVVVTAHSTVLFLFASQGLESFLIRHGLPSIPLVPVSSSQAVVGAVVGIGLLKGGRGIRWRLLGGISSGWVVTPIIAAGFCFISLFFLQNVFEQDTYRPVSYLVSPKVIERVAQAGIATDRLRALEDKQFPNAVTFKKALSKFSPIPSKDLALMMNTAEIHPMKITATSLNTLSRRDRRISAAQKKDLARLLKHSFMHKWELADALSAISPDWRFNHQDKKHDQALSQTLAHLYKIFDTGQSDPARSNR